MAVFVKTNLQLFDNFSSKRHVNRLRQIPKNTALFGNNIYGFAPKIYNKLPEDIKVINNLLEFKSTLKKLFIYKTYYTINEYLCDVNI